MGLFDWIKGSRDAKGAADRLNRFLEAERAMNAEPSYENKVRWGRTVLAISRQGRVLVMRN